jgi:hypothetical protein
MESHHGADSQGYLSPAGLLTVAAMSCLLLLALLAGPVSRAQAHDICIGHPSDPSVVCIRDAHRRIDVCDRQVDGHRTYARVTYGNYAYVRDFYDNNGGQSGCGNWWGWTVGPYDWAFAVNICVQGEGCGTPRYWWEW